MNAASNGNLDWYGAPDVYSEEQVADAGNKSTDGV
jgi:hypothetical protein